MIYDAVVREMIDRIYEEDFDDQMDYIRFVLDKVRKTDVVDIKVLQDMKVFYVPSEDYLSKFVTAACKDHKNNIYDTNGKCVWTGYLVFPVYDVGGSIRGFCGYDVLRALQVSIGDDEAEDWAKYKYSIDTVMNRGDFFLTPPGMYDKALQDKYVVLTDGVFDMVVLISKGYNALCLMGSYLSSTVLFTLKFIETKVLAEDNDKAGVELGQQLSKKLSGVVSLRQSKESDVHDISGTSLKDEYFRLLDRCIEFKVSQTLRVQ